MTNILKSVTCIWETNTIKTKRLIFMLIPSTMTKLAQDILQTRYYSTSDPNSPDADYLPHPCILRGTSFSRGEPPTSASVNLC